MTFGVRNKRETRETRETDKKPVVFAVYLFQSQPTTIVIIIRI